MKISLSGPAGSGKSSMIKALVEKLNCETADVGQIFRKRAADSGMTIAEYDKMVESRPEEDIAMDEDFRDLVVGIEGDVITSWRMGFHFVPDMFCIWLDVSEQEGAARILSDATRGGSEGEIKSVTEQMHANHGRMVAARDRLKKLYDVDFTEKSNYDLVLDTTGKTFDEVFGELLHEIEQRR